jgi:DNA polymerase I-like protein with 3'-5' exonuclease and polymerase domains
MNTNEFMIVRAILSALRGHKEKNHSKGLLQQDEKDLTDVLSALETAGFIVVPKGMMDSLKKLLEHL